MTTSSVHLVSVGFFPFAVEWVKCTLLVHSALSHTHSHIAGRMTAFCGSSCHSTRSAFSCPKTASTRSIEKLSSHLVKMPFQWALVHIKKRGLVAGSIPKSAPGSQAHPQSLYYSSSWLPASPLALPALIVDIWAWHVNAKGSSKSRIPTTTGSTSFQCWLIIFSKRS